MALAFSLTLPTDTTFISVGDIPELTAGAIYPPSDSQPESTDSGLDLHELKYAVCQTEHAKTLDRAIDERMVTLLNPLSFVPYTSAFGEARKRAVISIADFKHFAECLQIDVVLGDEFEPQHNPVEAPQGEINAEWQGELERMVKEWKASGKHSSIPTKGKLARDLSKSINVDSATIERRTRKTW